LRRRGYECGAWRASRRLVGSASIVPPNFQQEYAADDDRKHIGTGRANSWVELPPDVFNGLEEATVEVGEVGRLQGWSRVFDFVTRDVHGGI